MRIYINEQEQEIAEDINLSEIVEGMPNVKASRKKGIAIAVDNQVITRDLWSKYYPKENSKIIIITATQGG